MTLPFLKICLVATYDLAEEGGVKKHAVHLAHQLRALGDEVSLIGPYSGRAPLPPGTHGFGGVVNIPSNGSDNYMGIFASPLRVWRFLRAGGGYDVLHVMEPMVPSLAWYAAWFAGRAARVATFHAFSEQESASSKIARKLLGTPQLSLYDRGIAVSPAAARFAKVAWSRPQSLIPNGVDTAIFDAKGETVPRERDRPVRLLFVGHYRDPRKGLKTLLAAFASLRARGLSLTLDVIGEGGSEPRIEMEGLTYHGAISDEQTLASHYRRCDLFVAPSTGMESFGIVLLEAMATARPIVCSDIEGYRYVVPQDGARLTPAGGVEALVHALGELVANEPLRRRMGEINRRAALEFDWARVTSRVREEYLAALDAKRGLRTPQRSRERDARTSAAASAP